MTCLARALLCDLDSQFAPAWASICRLAVLVSSVACSSWATLLALVAAIAIAVLGPRLALVVVDRDLWRLEKGWLVAACHSPSVCARCHSQSEL
jgi:hypothetical protein